MWAGLRPIVYVVWGSTYLGIAIAIETIPPFLMAAIRFLASRHGDPRVGPPTRRLRETRPSPGARPRPPDPARGLDSFIVGGLLLGIGNGFVVFGEKTVPSGIAAILIGMMPLWFALLGWLYLRQRLPRLVVGAVAVGFGGVALLIWPSGDGANHFDPLGIFILFLAPLGWAHGSIYSVRRAKLPRSPLTASGFQMLAAAGCAGSRRSVNEPHGFDPAAVSSRS